MNSRKEPALFSSIHAILLFMVLATMIIPCPASSQDISPDSLIALGKQELGRGNIEQAEKLFLEVNEDNLPKGSEIFFEVKKGLAEIYYLKAKYPRAQNILKFLLQSLSDSLKKSVVLTALAEVKLELKEYDTTDILLTQADEYLDTRKDPLQLAEILHVRGNLYSRKYQLDSAIGSYSKSLDIKSSLLNAEEAKIADSYVGLATAYRKLGDYEMQQRYLLKALDIRRAALGEDHFRTSTVYNNLAFSYGKTGDLVKKELYYSKALKIRTRIFGEWHPSTAISYHNLSSVTAEMGRFQDAVHLANKSLKIHEKLYGSHHPKLAMNKHHIGWIYEEAGNDSLATMYYKEAIKILQAFHKKDHNDMVKSFNNLGNLQLRNGNLKEGGENLKKALEIRRSILGDEHPMTARQFNNVGKYYGMIGEDFKALDYYQQALTALNPDFNDKDILKNPTIESTAFNTLYLEIYKNKAISLENVFKATEKEIYRDASMEVLNLGIGVADLLRFNVQFSRDKYEIAKKTLWFYERLLGGLLSSGKTSDCIEAFRVNEKSKAFVLRQSLQEGIAMKFAHVPDSILILERELKIQKAYLQNRLQSKSLSGAARNDLTEHLLSIQHKYEDLILHLNKTYPKYSKLKYDINPPPISHAESLIPPGAALLSFFYGSDSIYLWTWHDKQLRSYTIPNTETLKQAINDYQYAISDYDFIINHPNARDLLIKSSLAIYQNLLQEALADLPVVESLIIIPDGPLGYLNFDALLTKSVSATTPFKDLPYLIKEFDISISTSLTVLEQTQSLRSKAKKSYVGFSPDYRNHPDFSTLAGASEEIRLVGKTLNGDLFLSDEATKSQFLAKASDYKVIHLAAHSQMLENNVPGLLFARRPNQPDADGVLTVYDIYNLDLSAEIVILSACSSGAGKFLAGEGLINLPRAFIYAGSGCVIMSLWPMADESGAPILTSFFKELKKGSKKTAALRQAKLNYLVSHLEDWRAHPFFWANLIAYGDSKGVSSIAEKSSYNTAAMLVVLSILILYLLKRKFIDKGV